MCYCREWQKDGTKANKTLMPVPDRIHKLLFDGELNNPQPKKIDACISWEVHELWQKEVPAIVGCCGHNVHDPFVVVPEKYIERMEFLGYKRFFEMDVLDGVSCFRSNSVPRIRKSLLKKIKEWIG